MKHRITGQSPARAIDPRTQRERRAVVVRSLVGVDVASAADGPAYTLSPEPMTTTPILDTQGRPRSVWSALLRLPREAYAALVCAVYPDCTQRGAAEVLVDSLLFEATQTRAFEVLPAGGWRVWIDAKHRASVEVAP
jgi:hypothetical protein